MTAPPETTVKDKNYDLIAVLQASLHYVWQMDIYALDAEAAGDTVLASWFRKIQANNRKAADQAKDLLMQRLTREGG